MAFTTSGWQPPATRHTPASNAAAQLLGGGAPSVLVSLVWGSLRQGPQRIWSYIVAPPVLRSCQSQRLPSLREALRGLDAGLTAAGERPGGPVALLAQSTVCAARNPRCATWSRLPGRDATALAAWTRRSRTRIQGLQVDQVDQVDQHPAAVRDWIMPPCGSRSRRQVDLP